SKIPRERERIRAQRGIAHAAPDEDGNDESERRRRKIDGEQYQGVAPDGETTRTADGRTICFKNHKKSSHPPYKRGYAKSASQPSRRVSDLYGNGNASSNTTNASHTASCAVRVRETCQLTTANGKR